MKKTFLISLFLLFTSSVFAVSIPGGGLPSEALLPSASYSEGNFRSSDQNIYPGDGAWEGTWNGTYGKTSAVDAMKKTPEEYVSINYPYNSTYVSFDGVLAAILGPCESGRGDYYDCYNYAVDVYNLALANWSLPMGDLEFVHYLMAPVSTDVALMAMFAGAYLAFALWRKKRSMAKI